MADETLQDQKGRPTGRPSVEAAGQLEEQLMDAALAVFIRCGYAGTSMEAIAREAGVTKRTLYRRAVSKPALFVEVVERLALKTGVPRLNRIAGATLEQKLRKASDIMLDWVLDPNALALYRMVVADAAHHPGLAATVDGPFQRATDAIAALLAQDGDRPAETVRLGAGMFLRLVISEPLDRAAQGIEAAGSTRQKRARAHTAVDFFLAGWRAWRETAARS
ncbi:TetR family transcriptional regulator [Xylophilus rhododendri]|uniref:TetR family transcriptional regulator n=1 Tax=Xylophilus rhododendri TaxID=2697032 RepID=A0A857J2H7_9BURK|nr:TetR/AcrR family transcriptional regulator [Xylophilus rhododendri]QHI97433.1 TetR family transcriptional regulator [Xylophilus rhododendri]